MPSRTSNSKSPEIRNTVGLQIRKLREKKNWSQADFVRELQLAGWDIERTMVTKIELRRRALTDFELLMIAKTLGVHLNDLVPKNPDFESFF